MVATANYSYDLELRPKHTVELQYFRNAAMTRLKQSLLTAVCLALLPSAAHAGVVITFASSLSLPAGTEGFLTVNLHSDTPFGDSLQGFIVTYQINGGSGLTFFTDGSGNPDEPQLEDPNYVFAGNSLSEDTDTGGSVSNAKDVYTQTDSTANNLGVHVGTTDVLLATLHFVAAIAGPYTISVDSVNTKFFDTEFAEIPFSVTSDGSVTVTEAPSTFVPEPGSFGVWGILALGLVAAGYRRQSDRRVAVAPIPQSHQRA
jgi:hypothetical protein